MLIAVVAFIVPVFVGVFEEIAASSRGVSAELPCMTQITVGVSDAITGYWYILFPAIAAAGLRLHALEEDRARARASGTG